MNQTTVTMPMSEYERNNELIKILQKESIEKFIEREYSSLERNEYTVTVDMAKVKDYIEKRYPNNQEIVFKSVMGKLIKAE